ncbi:MAG: ribosome assembly cofactor RimP [Muribaculaceae bacterium]|nr:ribosome assembly cofactor RimP [Muribaculaceae bacterium]MDE5974939.1 ribosome assembly cofactor RimP [Muribaculaceae bacterium]MDE6298597.1 ribosome assembly cofactor RimP [Muribaculaceae bacterium]
MIDKTALSDFIGKELEGSDLFLVEIDITPANEIRVEIDSDTSVDIDRCVDLTRKIEEEFDRDVEDYELEVGSSGLTTPFKVARQYVKNIGNEVEVLTADGRKLKGMLKNADDTGFTIVTEQKVKPEGSKRPVMEKSEITFGYGDVKSTKYLLQF